MATATEIHGASEARRTRIISFGLVSSPPLSQPEVAHDAPGNLDSAVDLVASIVRRRMVQFLALSCLVLIPWTIGLAMTLPRSYLVENWPLAWTGFDVMLFGCLSITAWSLWKQRQIAVPVSMIASVLLVCDAWFDIFTAHSGRCLVISIGTAAFAEIPLAVLLGLTSTRLLRASLHAARNSGPVARQEPLWRAPLPAFAGEGVLAPVPVPDRTGDGLGTSVIAEAYRPLCLHTASAAGWPEEQRTLA